MKFKVKALLLAAVAPLLFSTSALAVDSVCGPVWIYGLPGHKVSYTALEQLAWNVLAVNSTAVKLPFTIPAVSYPIYTGYATNASPGPVGHWFSSNTGPLADWLITGTSQLGDLATGDLGNSDVCLGFATWGSTSF